MLNLDDWNMDYFCQLSELKLSTVRLIIGIMNMKKIYGNCITTTLKKLVERNNQTISIIKDHLDLNIKLCILVKRTLCQLKLVDGAKRSLQAEIDVFLRSVNNAIRTHRKMP